MAIKKTVEERVAILDAKIAKKQEEINNLEAQRQKLLHPINMKTVMAKAKEAAEKLGLEI